MLPTPDDSDRLEPHPVDVPPCANHGDRLAVGIICTVDGRESYVCEVCADRFWALSDSPSASATLTYLRATL